MTNKNNIKHHLIKRVPIVSIDSNLKKVLSMLEKSSNKYDSVDYIYVIDKDKNLVGMFYAQDLFNRRTNAPVKKFMRKIVSVSEDMEIERVASIALKHNLKQIPVTRSRKLIGVVSTREIFSTINKSLKKDIFRSAGIYRPQIENEDSMSVPLLKAVESRTSWLIVGLAGAIIMAVYIGSFEEILTRHIIIASFIPAVVYMSGALATQFQTILVRDLAIWGAELNLKKYIARQIGIGTLMSIAIAIIMFTLISIIWQEPNIAFVISLASFISLFITGAVSIFITLLIKKFKFDPALGSGPIATVMSDLISVVVYFIIVALFI